MINMSSRILCSMCFFCVAASLFMIIPTTAVDTFVYDPWVDFNDDGKINIIDISHVAKIFGTTGSPINKADLLLELQTSRAHNETYSTTLETRSGYDFEWRDMPQMSLDITVSTTCALMITFSTEALTSTGYLELAVRAVVDSIPANPPTGIVLTKLGTWATNSFTFYIQNIAAGTHKASIQWQHNDEVGSVQVRSRTLIVTALPT